MEACAGGDVFLVGECTGRRDHPARGRTGRSDFSVRGCRPGQFFRLGEHTGRGIFFGLCAPNGLFFGPGRISGRDHPARGKRAKELKDKRGESPAEKE